MGWELALSDRVSRQHTLRAEHDRCSLKVTFIMMVAKKTRTPVHDLRLIHSFTSELLCHFRRVRAERLEATRAGEVGG